MWEVQSFLTVTQEKWLLGGGGSLQKVFGTMPFQSKENTLFDIKRALQKGDFHSFAEKGRGLDPTRPPVVAVLGLPKPNISVTT